MTKYCEGCGAVLQTTDRNIEGYVSDMEHTLCERCFRIRNYNDYKSIAKDNTEFMTLLEKINETNDLVVLVVDLMHIHPDIQKIACALHNPLLLVLTKRDLLPRTTYDSKLLQYVDRFQIPFVDKVMISSRKNDHMDELYEKIQKYQTSPNVYVVGLTNAGKSTMLNQMIYNYSDVKREITTSMLPSTTMNFITIPISEGLTFIDTPGILDQGNMLEYIDYPTMKKVVPRSEIRPRTYQIKDAQTHVIDSLLRVDYKTQNSVTYYISNVLKVERYYKNTDRLQELERHEITVCEREDVVISGFGFIKIMKPCKLTLFTLKGVSVYTRDSLI